MLQQGRRGVSLLIVTPSRFMTFFAVIRYDGSLPRGISLEYFIFSSSFFKIAMTICIQTFAVREECASVF